jgi:hypothetical protein
MRRGKLTYWPDYAICIRIKKQTMLFHRRVILVVFRPIVRLYASVVSEWRKYSDGNVSTNLCPEGAFLRYREVRSWKICQPCNVSLCDS